MDAPFGALAVAAYAHGTAKHVKVFFGQADVIRVGDSTAGASACGSLCDALSQDEAAVRALHLYEAEHGSLAGMLLARMQTHAACAEFQLSACHLLQVMIVKAGQDTYVWLDGMLAASRAHLSCAELQAEVFETLVWCIRQERETQYNSPLAVAALDAGVLDVVMAALQAHISDFDAARSCAGALAQLVICAPRETQFPAGVWSALETALMASVRDDNLVAYLVSALSILARKLPDAEQGTSFAGAFSVVARVLAGYQKYWSSSRYGMALLHVLAGKICKDSAIEDDIIRLLEDATLSDEGILNASLRLLLAFGCSLLPRMTEPQATRVLVAAVAALPRANFPDRCGTWTRLQLLLQQCAGYCR